MRFAAVAAVASIGGLLFGFDTGVISGALLFIRQEFALNPWMQGIVTTAVLVGAVAGAAAGGALTDRFGRRRVILAIAILFAFGSLLSAAANGPAVLVLARIALGVAIGVASLSTPLYLSEVAPREKRGAAVSLNQVCVTLGILASYLVDLAFAHVAGTWRWMLGVGVVPGLLLGIGMLFVPESPRWLAARGRLDAAGDVLRTLRNRDDVEDELAGLRHDAGSSEGDVPLRTLIAAPGARRPLIIGIGLAIFQQVTGINTVIYYAPTIFEQAGTASPLLATVGIGVVNVLATLVALLLLDRAGRRSLLLAGVAIMMACLTLAAATAPGGHGQGAPVATAAALAAYVGGFAIGLGPIFWLLIAEVFPLAYRGRGMSVASVVNWGANLLVALIFPSLVALAGLRATFAIFALFTAAAFAFAWVLVPETKGRSLEEIERDLAGRAAIT